jgi:hypothetical protein
LLTGYNTDVVFEGTVLHVQSEDKGENNPILETLVYCGGQILHHERTEYSDWLSRDAGPEDVKQEIATRLDRQHRDVVRRARHGEFLLHAARRFDVADEGEALLDTVQRLLQDEDDLQPLELVWSADMVAYGGVAGRLIVRRGGPEGGPAEGVRVLVRLLGCGLEPVRVFEGQTGPDGSVEIAVALPPAGATAMLFRAEDGAAGGRLRVGLGTGGDPAEARSASEAEGEATETATAGEPLEVG